MEAKRKICVVGGGLAGPMIGIMMAKRGYEVEILERRVDMRKVNISAGRSINLALSVRGFSALETIGLKEELLKISIPMVGRMIHDIDGKTHLQRYGKDDSQAIYSVSRGSLNCILLDMAEGLNIKLHFETQVTKYDLKNNTLFCKKKVNDNFETFEITDHLVIAADGYLSTIRESIQRETRFNYSQKYESHGYKELTLPSGPNESFLIEKNALHIWPRGGFMLIALPNLDGNFTCTLFMSNEEGEENFAKLNTQESIAEFFQKYFKDAYDMMPNLVEQFQRNPVGALCTIKAWPWNYKDQAVLIGDAAHSLVPFYGQGMNCAFEDCVVFAKMHDQALQSNSLDWTHLLSEFAKSRKPNTNAIQKLAVQNFVEMRDLVNDPFFKLKRECEMKIAKKYPDFITKYSLISFSTTPYDIAKRRGEVNDNVLSELCRGLESAEHFNEDEGYQKITAIYKQLSIEI